jgi:hypothetical protein
MVPEVVALMRFARAATAQASAGVPPAAVALALAVPMVRVPAATVRA